MWVTNDIDTDVTWLRNYPHGAWRLDEKWLGVGMKLDYQLDSVFVEHVRLL